MAIAANKPREWRFLQLTLVLAAWMLVAPHVQDRWIVQFVVQLVLANSLLMAMWASPEEHRMRRIMVTLWIVSLVGSALALAPRTEDLRNLGRIAEVASRIPLLALLALGILRFAFRRMGVTSDGIFATVAVYLLVAFLFADIYVLVFALDPASFNLKLEDMAGSHHALHGTMVYFSIVTLATLGYGDVLPLSQVARSLAVIEAVVGQFYVGVIVAVFIGKLTTERRTINT